MTATATHDRRRWLRPLLALVMLAIAALIGWRVLSHWRPDRAEWPLQGIAVGTDNRPLAWPTLVQLGANFAYVDATAGRRVTNRQFTADSAAATAAGVRVGAIHHYALCELASDQASVFVRLVPRDPNALPPLIQIDDAADCTRRPSRALLLTELTTFLSQVETHMGKPAIIAPSGGIEEEFQLSSAINRSLMVRRDWRVPSDGARPWALWQANSHLRIDGATGAVRWLVLHGESE